ncbi:MAG: hypothetical protein QXN26_00370 [Thermoplasmataceae archaeon]
MFLLLPTIILATSIGVYKALNVEIRRYMDQLKQSSEARLRVMNLVFFRKMLQFFGNSKTSKATGEILNEFERKEYKKIENAGNIAGEAMDEIEDLHRYLMRISQSQKEISSLETMFNVLSRMIVIYGATVAAAQYVVLVISGEISHFDLIRMLVNIIVEASLIFGMIVILIYLDINHRIKLMKREELKDAWPGDSEIDYTSPGSM